MRYFILAALCIGVVASADWLPGYPARGGGSSSGSASLFTFEGYNQRSYVNRCLLPPQSGTADINIGLAGTAPTFFGTNTGASTLATTNALTSVQRHIITINGTTANYAGIWSGASAQSGLSFTADTDGGAAGTSQTWGANMLVQWGASPFNATARYPTFVGLRENFDGGTACRTPSSLPNTAYVGCDNGQSTLYACTNDGTGSATCTDLGANFPCMTDGVLFNTYIVLTSTSAAFTVENVGTGALTTVTATTDLPVTTAMLGFDLAMCTDAGSSTFSYSLLCVGSP